MDENDARARIAELVDRINAEIIERGEPDWSMIAAWGARIGEFARGELVRARRPVS